MDLKDEERADNGKDKSEDPGKEIGRPAPHRCQVIQSGEDCFGGQIRHKATGVATS